MNGPRVTIRDVAHAAGASMASVSKALNDGYGVSAAMREKVLQAAADLGYRPNPAARAMRGRSHTVGIVADIGAPIVAQITEGVQEGLDGSSLDIVLAPAGNTPERQRHSIDAMLDRNVDGLILVVPTVPYAVLDAFGQATPTVVIGRHGGGRHFDSVMDDDAAGAGLAVEHLADLGHRRISHIAMPMGRLRRPSVLPQTAREDGYVASMRAHGLEPHILTTDYSEEGGHAGALAALGSESPPTAIFAGTDTAALGVLRAAHELGLRVPQDLSVIGADNLPVGALPQISLTTIDPAGKLNGSTSAKLLRERIDGRRNPVTYAISPSMVVRSTTAPPRE
ncbi:LacI family DNA-binding transcriptional regulator [Kitasatospora sp. YST-16]|uniref:LacI family DNA-binding transcriptional regulator n=1 Tax=Kitasatospora sp. YST-16 TaxID=2998080 RepID=UPI002283B352|nr:LacI family DNA-binding transcriptional regulator [Kitasatospora sp. YST-16]WAL74667.1 LacI family DNA-binding transcriptional regulator [Kitasatospora sp. YST-16]WNW40722.1 LacI family DNA-binding transcriptional regulator [Streptomyces sp. Li-HN-5-13]